MAYKQLDLTAKVAIVVGGSSESGKQLHWVWRRPALMSWPARGAWNWCRPWQMRLNRFGRRSLRVTCDVADRDSLDRLLQACLDAFGKVDILVNAAGITKRAPTLEVSEEDWNLILDTNLTGTLRACQVFGRHMVERRYGRIINIASMGSFLALFASPAYSASKSGLASLTKSLAIEWAGHGVCVNAILPHTSALRSAKSCWWAPAVGQR